LKQIATWAFLDRVEDGKISNLYVCSTASSNPWNFLQAGWQHIVFYESAGDCAFLYYSNGEKTNKLTYEFSKVIHGKLLLQNFAI